MPRNGDRKGVTIREVAAQAGVSIATVSHTLNRPDKVSPATRARVLDVVDELGFTPKQTAVSLARRGVGRIAVVAPFTPYPSYFTRLLGVFAACRDRQIDVVVFDDLDQPTARSPLLSSLPATGRIDGLILMGVEPSAQVSARLTQRDIPTVLVDRSSDVFSSVTVNDELGGRLLADHLLAQGCSRFTFASPRPPDIERVTSGELRLRGYREAVRAAGVEAPEWFTTQDDSMAGGRAIAAQLLAAPALPDAVFAVHDVMAAGVIAGLLDAGVRVPQDVRVVGYDDIDLAEALDITTMRQPFAQSGRAAAEVLLERRDDPLAAVRQITLSPELVVRRSG